MIAVRVGHTAEIEPAVLAEARALLYAVFDDMTEEDWEHCLGGIHAIAYEGPEVVGHASVVMRRLVHAGRALRTGYVECVGVRADCRRRGHASAMMAPLERLVRDGYEVGALGATDEGAAFYASRGWRRWDGPLGALTPSGPIATPEAQGAVYVLPVEGVPLDPSGRLVCDWRDGDVW